MLSEVDFEREIAARTDDIEARLIYADWLEERRDPRGEFIRVQCALAMLGADDPRRRRLAYRSQELLHKHHSEWVAPLLARGMIHLWFSRGFVEEAQLVVDRFLARGEELFAAAPALTAVRFSKLNRATCSAVLEKLREVPGIKRIESLDLAQGAVGPQELQILAEIPLRNLKLLNLSWNDWLNDESLQRLANSHLTNKLEVLDLRGVFFGPTAAQALVESSGLTRLKVILTSSNLTLSRKKCAYKILRRRFGQQITTF